MKMSDIIADFIGDMLVDGGGIAEIQRRELADKFSCVPSQISYVIETRFSNENGYIVESRRGGGGYIRIMRKMTTGDELVINIIEHLAERITEKHVLSIMNYLLGNGILNKKEANIFLGCCSDVALDVIMEPHRDALRAEMLRTGLISLITD